MGTESAAADGDGDDAVAVADGLPALLLLASSEVPWPDFESDDWDLAPAVVAAAAGLSDRAATSNGTAFSGTRVPAIHKYSSQPVSH